MNLSNRHKIISLNKKEEIKYILDTSKKVYTKYGIIFLKKSDESDRKAGILLKRNIGNAVKRNYIKRLIRSYIRENIALMYNYNRVIFLFNKKINCNYKQLKDEYSLALKNEISNTIVY